MIQTDLSQIVQTRPFHEYKTWWALGPAFVGHMSQAILTQWRELGGDLRTVETTVEHYLNLVYGQRARTDLLTSFVQAPYRATIRSGEFDALSYAFFRSAFNLIERELGTESPLLASHRRRFTKKVGRAFFKQLQYELDLQVPANLGDESGFALLKNCTETICAYLRGQGYLRDDCQFSFTLDVEHAGRTIRQNESQFVTRLKEEGVAYAIYVMGYPVILPSAVYLFHTMGEAQHHSSRIIEELFSRAGCEASETDDFDPTDYPSDRVVELWRIRKR